MARKEIVDYLVGIGLETSFHGLKLSGEERAGIVVGPDLRGAGWRGRLAKGTYDLLQRAAPEELKKLGLKEGVVNSLVRHRETLLESWREGGAGFWGSIRNVGLKGWEKLAQYAAEDQSVKIDTVVTTDIHRLIRLNNTLHGKTGFKKIDVPITEIESFDPFKEAIAFNKGAVTLAISQAPKFRIGDENYGPYENQKVELPTAAALFLLCKGAATVVN
jgi:DNA primase small subunit